MSTLPFIDDRFVAENLDVTAVREAIARAFASLAAGTAQIQARTRIECGAFRLSAMGAVWLDEGLAAVKTYGTVAGRFDFVCNLFDTATGSPLATVQGNEITRFRTSALSVHAAMKLATGRRVLALFGTGVQGSAHLDALMVACPFDEVRVVGRGDIGAWCADASARWQRPVRPTAADAAVDGADVIVTATRSKVPLFDGSRVKHGATVIAVGASLPTGSELDDTTLGRADRVIVEWKPQSLVEAGEVVTGRAHGVLPEERIVDLVELGAEGTPWRRADDEVVIFKSVGVGLTDLAAAALVWKAWQARHGG
jgi:ornithine cyclodeaminase